MPVFLSLPGSGRGRAKQLNPLGVSVIMIQANKYKGKGIMRKLLIYLNEYRKECILAPLFLFLAEADDGGYPHPDGRGRPSGWRIGENDRI